MTEDLTLLLDKISGINLTGQPRSIDMKEKIIDAIINDSKYVSAAFLAKHTELELPSEIEPKK